MIWQDSFYHSLTEDELARVHEYNFDHPGENIYGMCLLYIRNAKSILIRAYTFLCLHWIIKP